MIVATGMIAVWQIDWVPSVRLYEQAAMALDEGHFEEAGKLGRRLMARSTHRAEGMLFVAESCCKQGEFSAALELLEQARAERPDLSEIACLMTARIQCDELHRPADAERTLREVLRGHPSSLPAHEKLAFILGLAGRSWEATESRLLLVSQDQFPLFQLSLLALGRTAAENPDLVQEFARTSPEDVIVKCGLARLALREGRIEEGELLIDDVIRQQPSLLVAQAWKGELLLSRRDDAGLDQWLAALPPAADSFPDIWFVRGGWAMQRDEPRAAVRCYWECLRQDGHHQSANYQLAQALTLIGEPALAERFRQQSHLLSDLITAAKTVEISGSLETARQAAVISDQLGLQVESDAWREVLRRSDPRARWQMMTDSRARYQIGTPRTTSDRHLLDKLDFASFPLPQRSSRASMAAPSDVSRAGSDRIHFAEEAQSVGIDFTYHNGSPAAVDGEYMYEFSGGAVVAFDYDIDGWPDLYFSQGSEQSPQIPQQTWLDRLYRNLGNGQFDDSTAASGILEPGFSQGAAAGDFDNDGFPDLYVGNIGANRLFHNNGDGTFTDITESTGTAGDRWTTSCVIADLNGDGNPDIFTVNYVTGQDLLTKPCRMQDGSTRLCTPHEFPAAHDQLFLNRGDGRFEDLSLAAGIEVPEGKGLGVVAGSFDGSGSISLFVANDAVPNFYLVNSAHRADPPHFEERGYLSGVAVDADGQPQACMGIAAGDANGDGRLDLFVTNFRNESNTLYLQQPGGSFVDETRRSGLREPSFAMLGFGTQFLDADLDGWLDLVITNGHVGNLKHHGVPYEMPPQFYQNVGEGKFVELPSSTLGSFFRGEYLGRGLARIDWNRDGKEDFVVSHLKSRGALVTNQTTQAGNSVILQLRGVDSDRDAIGSSVIVQAGGRQLMRQLTAGDGYQACNQRQLVIGVGPLNSIDQVEVHWPAGRVQRLINVPVNCELLLIEGRDDAITLRTSPAP